MCLRIVLSSSISLVDFFDKGSDSTFLFVCVLSDSEIAAMGLLAIRARHAHMKMVYFITNDFVKFGYFGY